MSSTCWVRRSWAARAIVGELGWQAGPWLIADLVFWDKADIYVWRLNGVARLNGDGMYEEVDSNLEDNTHEADQRNGRHALWLSRTMILQPI